MGELVFFDVETTMPTGAESRCWMLEFGAILVCPRKLIEIGSYSTLIRPADLSVVSPHRISGITREAVSSAPPFEDVAEQIYKIMNGWLMHVAFFVELVCSDMILIIGLIKTFCYDCR
jgi:DNA polymerase III epsilon subunit-like protein